MNFVAVAYILWAMAAGLQLLGTILPYWKVNDPSGQIIELREVNIGLWHKCTGYATGIFSCDDFDSIWLGQQSEVTTARALMGITMCLDLIVLVCFQVAAPWVSCSSGDIKRKVMQAASVSMLFANICTAAGSGYYGSKVLNDYYTLNNLMSYKSQSGLNTNSGFSGTGGDAMKFGGSLYACWVSCVFGFSATVMMFCCLKNELDLDDDEYYDPNEGTMVHNSHATGAPPSGFGIANNRKNMLPNPHFEMQGQNQPPGKHYEMRQGPQPYV